MNQYRVSPDDLVHIRAAAEHGHTALAAAKRLVRSAADLDQSALRIVYDGGRMAVLTVRRFREGECPECGGIGPVRRAAHRGVVSSVRRGRKELTATLAGGGSAE